MADLSLPLKPELKKSLEQYDVRPRDGRMSGLEISKMPAEARAQLFENALNGSETEKRVALALFKKMTDAQVLDTIDKFSVKPDSLSCCPAAGFYLGALVDQDLPRIKSMYRHESGNIEETREKSTHLLVLLQNRFAACTLTPEQSAKLNPIVNSWAKWAMKP